MLFRELRFYLSRALSAEDKEELERLIRQHGGIVSTTPVGATQLVDYDKLNAGRPEWISADFIKESVAFRALQDPAKYSGAVFTAQQERSRDSSRRVRVRVRYSNEDDARLLHFAKQKGWKATESLALSFWQQAESEQVTTHTAHSMHQRFRKHLQMTTPKEQRAIMARAAAITRARLLERDAEVEEIDDDEEQKEEEQQQEEVMAEPTPRALASPSPTGFRDAATPESAASTQSRTSARTPSSASHQRVATSEQATIEGRLREVGEEKFIGRARSRKPKSPLRLSQRLQPSERVHSSSSSEQNSYRNVASPAPTAAAPLATPTATPATPASPPEVPNKQAVQSTSAPSAGSSSALPSSNDNAGRTQQKRKRRNSSAGSASSQGSRSSHQEVGGSDPESIGSKTSGSNGIFFRSVWVQQLGDQGKRRLLQRFFDPPAKPAPESQTSTAESATGSDPNKAAGPGESQVSEVPDERMDEVEQEQVEQATDQDTDDIICQLQMESHQDLHSVVHALYYCSGDVEMAKSFLKGASPPSMWSPEDDLLLVDLLANEGTSRTAVGAAVTRGDFSSMQVARDTDAILKRVQFLR